ncbi:hypothetical protein GW916_01010 [bacterium]|nr:hypothetical protein [bacterium]
MKKWLVLVLFSTAGVQAEKMPLAHSPQCTFQAVASKMGVPIDESIPLAKVDVQSESLLQDFQDSVFDQYGFKPNTFASVYIQKQNRIFLIDDLEVYAPMNRFVDDSLAHELVHYVQVMYQGLVNDGSSDQLEMDAIKIQTWYRETFMETGLSPCE